MVTLPVVPLRERVVEVEVDLGKSGEPYRYGSGFRLGGRLVLTAAHVVADASAAKIMVRGPDKVPHPAYVVEGLVGDPDDADLALLQLTDEAAELPTTPAVASVNRDAAVPVPVDGCWAVGYPLFQEVASSSAGSDPVTRETAQVWGMILPAENLVGGLLSLQVTSAPRDLPPHQEALGESQWSGMSGAAVFAGERLLGVVSEHAPRRGPSTITVTPLTRVDRMPNALVQKWWTHLNADPAQLIELPERRRREEPAYRRVLRHLRERTMLVGRDVELAKIRAFATGAATGLDPLRTGCAWLVGDAWAGKTALLAEAVHTLPPEVDWVAYFLSRTGGDADRERFVRAVVPQLAYLLDKDAPARSDEYMLAELWEQAGERAVRAGRQLLLVVDGLDEDLRPGGYSVAGWLPPPRPGARVLVTSRPQLELSVVVDLVHPLARAAATTVTVSPAASAVRDRAEREIADLLARRRDKLCYDLLGVLAAAAGPLASSDLVELTGSSLPEVDIFVTADAARTLRLADAAASRYEFAHETLLATCRAHRVVGDRGYARRLYEWAAIWRDRGWPAAHDGTLGTPLYLLDTYPQTLYDDPPRVAALVGDVAWVETAIRTIGVDTVVAELRTAGAAAPSEPRVVAMLAAVVGQAYYLRSSSRPLGQPGYVLRQLCLQAAELADDRLADDFRTRLRSQPGPGLVPVWTTHRASRALAGELGRHDSAVNAVAVLPDGRVVSGGDDRRVLVWDPDRPHTAVDLGRHGDWAGAVTAVAVLPDGRVVSGGYDGRVLVWDPDRPHTAVELGRHDDSVTAVAVLPDRRVVSGGNDRRVLVWDPDRSYWDPDRLQTAVELGRHDGAVTAMAVLPDGRVVSGGDDGRVLVWDVTTQTGIAQVGCSVTAMATGPLGPGESSLIVVHEGGGFSLWSVTRGSQELLPPVS